MVQTKDVWIEARFEAQKRAEHKRVPRAGSKEKRRRQRVSRIYAEEEEDKVAASLSGARATPS